MTLVLCEPPHKVSRLAHCIIRQCWRGTIHSSISVALNTKSRKDCLHGYFGQVCFVTKLTVGCCCYLTGSLEILPNSAWKMPLPHPSNEYSSSKCSQVLRMKLGIPVPQNCTGIPAQCGFHSNSQFYVYQWEASRGLFINCVRKCLYVYSPESSRAE